ncbi:hypothetical protein NP493_31g06019 [Ridgeia piscesae]|uniref:ADF-H domain-containing protein n=1 Tax=Ridgeia piscesae TaxID=27915 RepID=A0AAD9PCT9_RIDPI|nr:hypothetical protein NP493_31g06019 [Ridgeia piscesae]
MASGVSVKDECKQVFTDIKLGRKYRYVVYRLTDDLKEITVESTAGVEASYDDFVDQFKAAESSGQCRYGVFDAEYQTKDGNTKNKLVFFMWSPDGAKIKQKMVYSSSKDALKRALGEGIGKEVQANDHGDLDWSNVKEIISRMDRN